MAISKRDQEIIESVGKNIARCVNKEFELYREYTEKWNDATEKRIEKIEAMSATQSEILTEVKNNQKWTLRSLYAIYTMIGTIILTLLPLIIESIKKLFNL